MGFRLGLGVRYITLQKISHTVSPSSFLIIRLVKPVSKW